MTIPNEVANYFATFYKDKPYTISDIERYENIYAVEFYSNYKSKTAYIPVSKEKRMSDSEGCG